MKKIIVTDDYTLKGTNVYLDVQEEARIFFYPFDCAYPVVIDNNSGVDIVLTTKNDDKIHGEDQYTLEAGQLITLTCIDDSNANSQLWGEGTMASENSAQIKALSTEINGTSWGTIVLLGDSITEGCGQPDFENYPEADRYGITQKGFWGYANSMLGQFFDFVHNGGVGGERTDEILLRINSDVLTYTPRYCHILAGTNDIGQGIATNVIVENLKEIISTIDNNGIIPIIGAIPPRTSYTGTQLEDTSSVNLQLKNYCIENKYFYVDYFGALNNGDGTGDSIYYLDSVHMGPVGGFAMGYELARILKASFAEERPTLPTTNVDSKQYITNTMFLTDLSDFSVVGTPTLVQYDNLPSCNWAEFTLGSGERLKLVQFIDFIDFSDLGAGDSVYAVVELEFDENVISVERIDLDLRSQEDSTVLEVSKALRTEPSNYVYNTLVKPTRMILKTPKFEIKAPANRIIPYIEIYGEGTFRISRFGVMKD